MNPDFNRLLAAPVADRRDLFLAAAARLGTTVQNVEKDFWVCWTLDALFNGLQPGGPRLLFKGGTSLSKGYGLIERFSEDIDITVFRADIDAPASVEDLEALSRKQRERRLDDIRKACQAFIGGPLTAQLEELAAGLPIAGGQLRMTLDDDDADGQSSVAPVSGGRRTRTRYIRPAVKIEAGAKSALDPHAPLSVRPYVADDLAGFNLTVPNVTTVDPVRTFWDKVLILHSLRRSFEDRGKAARRRSAGLAALLRRRPGAARGNRPPRGHRPGDGRAIASAMSACSSTAPVTDTAHRAASPSCRPTAMLDQLRLDYAAMAVMIFGEVPAFDAVMDSIAALEATVNR